MSIWCKIIYSKILGNKQELAGVHLGVDKNFLNKKKNMHLGVDTLKSFLNNKI